jgi:hypothetical protein
MSFFLFTNESNLRQRIGIWSIHEQETKFKFSNNTYVLGPSFLPILNYKCGPLSNMSLCSALALIHSTANALAQVLFLFCLGHHILAFFIPLLQHSQNENFFAVLVIKSRFCAYKYPTTEIHPQPSKWVS